MQDRIKGFDLARAYAIFGMFIVNFRFCFGAFTNSKAIERFLNLFTGNSTSIFIVLAGMGLSLMTYHAEITLETKEKLKKVVLKRSWFLFALGLSLYSWWPGDILHFYGGYMHIAAFLLFIPKKYYLWGAFIAILIFHALLFVIPIETAWDFKTTQYLDFWTIKGFLRNSLYNGWNAMFPWIAYFLLGMWLGRLNWQENNTKKSVFISGLTLFSIFQILRLFARNKFFEEKVTEYIMSEYFPPYLPFMAITAGFALMVIPFCVFLGEKFAQNSLVNALCLTGRMTLTHYVMHLTLGMMLFSRLSGHPYTGYWQNNFGISGEYIFIFALCFFVASVIFSVLWSKKFKNGPLETLMRKFSA